jgi:hypothetical protein
MAYVTLGPTIIFPFNDPNIEKMITRVNKPAMPLPI